jgi:hypothetical protein
MHTVSQQGDTFCGTREPRHMRHVIKIYSIGTTSEIYELLGPTITLLCEVCGP